MNAYLILEDGTIFRGTSIGAVKEVISEIVFNTSMTGYLEILTDPSYAGQAVVMTYPLIGNYGISHEDEESRRAWPDGYIVREISRRYSNFRSTDSIEHYLKKHDIPGIAGIDTRELTRILREKGTMNGMITTKEYADLDEILPKLKAYKPTGVVKKVTCENKAVLPAYSVPETIAKWEYYRLQGLKASEILEKIKGGAEDADARTIEHAVRAGMNFKEFSEEPEEASENCTEKSRTGSNGELKENPQTVSNGELPAGPQSDLDKVQAANLQENLKKTQGEPEEASSEKIYRVALLDVGAKRNIAESLSRRGCEVTVYPASTPAEEILADAPDGIMLSNGPGDPKECTEIIAEIKKLYDSDVPIFAICLGHQLMALATGGDTHKMKYGHRGANHPVKDLKTGKVYISSQNHGYVVDETKIDPEIAEVGFINVNDGTVEGLRYKNKNIFTVQFHPEASPGPRDSAYLFDEFLEMMERGKHNA
ncbi:MAG: carbamoyl phosphate synthase small subunit [Lachnospiraceae bacterium]|nr:carbamoyl phosphate synthase small subunit [Lachnospiraceae bacterium]